MTNEHLKKGIKITARMAFVIALCALASGQLEARALSATSAPPNYWCTWGVQGTTLHKIQ